MSSHTFNDHYQSKKEIYPCSSYYFRSGAFIFCA
jgi:hypothetical protein